MALLVPLSAAADPLVVHAGMPRHAHGPTDAQRLAVGNAVAEVLATGQPDVLRATDTRARVATLAPAAVACDAPECATAMLTPLRARGVVLVTLQPGRHQHLALTLRWLDAQGTVRATQTADEVVANWDDALAVARVTARTLLAAIPPVPAAPAVVASTAILERPAPTPVVVTAAPPRTVEVAPSAPAPAGRRRAFEAVMGGALVAAGGTFGGLGAASFARDGSVAQTLPNGREEVYAASTRDTVFLVVGGAAVAAGVVLLVDGLRARPAPARVSAWTAPLPGGAIVGLGGAL